jgi:hypothetical protein
MNDRHSLLITFQRRHLAIPKLCVSWGKGSWSFTQYMIGRRAQVSFLWDNCIRQWALSWTMEGEYHGQKWTISFLWKKRKSVADIHRWLAAMFVWRNCPKLQNSVAMGRNFQQRAWKCQGGNQSRPGQSSPSANSLHVTGCAAGLLHHHAEQVHNNGRECSQQHNSH